MIKKKNRPVPKTEGQRQLLEVWGSQRGLAAKVGCGKSVLGYWRRGERMPSDEQKHKLELLFGIPRKAWDVEPGAKIDPAKWLEEKPPKKIEQQPASQEPLLSSRAKGMDTLTITKMQIDDLLDALDEPKLTEAASAKLRDTLTKALALRTRLERDQELLEDRFVREHPKWLELKGAILAALRPFPDATKAVIEAIGSENDY